MSLFMFVDSPAARQEELCRLNNEQMERESLAAPPPAQVENRPGPPHGIITEREKQRLVRIETRAKTTGMANITMVNATEPFMNGYRKIVYRVTFHPDGSQLWEILTCPPAPMSMPPAKKRMIVNGVLS